MIPFSPNPHFSKIILDSSSKRMTVSCTRYGYLLLELTENPRNRVTPNQDAVIFLPYISFLEISERELRENPTYWKQFLEDLRTQYSPTESTSYKEFVSAVWQNEKSSSQPVGNVESTRQLSTYELLVMRINSAYDLIADVFRPFYSHRS